MSFVAGPDGVSLGIGPHRVRLLPRGAPHVVHLTGPAAASADLFGMRFELSALP